MPSAPGLGLIVVGLAIGGHAGARIGLPHMRPSSFRKAMTEMAPVATPSGIFDAELFGWAAAALGFTLGIWR